MRIHLHFLAKNESRILPYFFKHYNQYNVDNNLQYFAHFNVNSTDGTLKLLQENTVPVTLIKDRNLKLDERFLIEMKNTTWMKYSNPENCDWVILVDTDEILYNEDFLGLLERYDKEGVNFPQILGYQMYNDTFPTEDKQIHELIKRGRAYHPYNKQVVLKPNIAPNYSYGCHFSSPTGPNVKTSEEIDIKLLHYKIFGEAYVKERLAVNDTLSDFNKAVGCGVYNTIPGHAFNPQVEYESIKIEAKDVI